MNNRVNIVLAVIALIVMVSAGLVWNYNKAPINVNLPEYTGSLQGLTEESKLKIEEIITKYIKSQNPGVNVNKFRIASSYDIAHGKLVFVLFQNGNRLHQGVFQLEQLNSKTITVKWDDFPENDTSVAFTQHQFFGDSSINGELKNPFLVISGIVNKSDIRKINITFNDGKNADINLGSNNYYSYVRIDKNIYIKSIIGFDKNGKVIYSYKW